MKHTLRLPSIFSSGMVLQHGMDFPVWGWSAPGDRVTVEFADQKKNATAGKNGRWSVDLDPVAISREPRTMTITSSKISKSPGLKISKSSNLPISKSSSLQIKNILVGDVWVCSGQSNMEWPLKQTIGGDDAIRRSANPAIRLFSVPRVMADKPAEECDAIWMECNPETVAQFSGVAYYFGMELYRMLGIPLGLIHTSWGGTKAEAWTSREALKAYPELGHLTQESISNYKKALQPYTKICKFDPPKGLKHDSNGILADPGRNKLTADWAKPYYDDSRWVELNAPGSWESQGIMLDGAVWFRKKIKIPASWEGKDLCLELGALDDFDVAFFNGNEVGRTGKETENWWSTPRKYSVPGKLVEKGEAVIAIRIFDQFMSGGMMGPAEKMKIYPAGNSNEEISLKGKWLTAVELGIIVSSVINSSKLYNAMISPILSLRIKGAIWYQGCSNTDRAYQYRTLLPVMIRDWRKNWDCGNFSFLIVQLANYMESHEIPCESAWAELREAQLLTSVKVPNCGLAVAIDIGEAKDIHPKNKKDVGLRLALQAVNKVYGKNIVCDGPVYREMKVKGDSIVLKFETSNAGLESLDGKKLRGFAVADSTKKFQWAEAKIVGNTVVVSSSKVKKPVAARYAWADNPECNFGNDLGLPASPFRTDNWMCSTRHAK
ncbi:MAG TPA: 9-O-acetylesterase [Lentisphaeria bacterium]|nr:MAG: hypothetical protein A2X45_18715 [Lentisphaerae bacterium GWF2_50_93]HCE46868.1 9-O-acetylesterase [Lentisphaeria bacterium]